MVKTVDASPFVCALKGAVTALIISLLTIPVSAWILTGVDDPQILISVTPKAVQLISAVIGGIICSRAKGDGGIVTSLISGGMYTVFILIGAVISSAQILPMILMSVFIISAFILGYVIGRPKEKSGNAKRKEMMKRLK